MPHPRPAVPTLTLMGDHSELGVRKPIPRGNSLQDTHSGRAGSAVRRRYERKEFYPDVDFSGWPFVAFGPLRSRRHSLRHRLNTVPLISHPAGPFSFGISELNDGTGIRRQQQLLRRSATSLLAQAGAAVGSLRLNGGGTGTLGSAVTITDSSFFNGFRPAVHTWRPSGL